MRKLVLFALASIALLAPAAADHVTSVQYVGYNDRCQIQVEYAHERPLDPTSDPEVTIWISGVAPDDGPTDIDPACGSHLLFIYCEDVVGSYEEGIFCRWGDSIGQRIIIGGTAGAPEMAPGVYDVAMDYYYWPFEATAFVVE